MENGEVDVISHDTSAEEGSSPVSVAKPESWSTKVQVQQIPKNADWEEFGRLCKKHGEALSIEHSGTGDNAVAIVAYKTLEEAQKAVNDMNNMEWEGATLKASFYTESRPRPPRKSTRSSGPSSEYAHRPNTADMPLRIAVDARYVGAIIGQGGSNIRSITKDSKARCVVDVNRGFRDVSGNPEKVINIYGLPENCSKACLKILEVIQRESAKEQPNHTKESETELKVRAHNNLVGRLIGKGGTTIKKIMEETGCNIFVSSISELSAFNMERTITIRGSSLEKIGKAEERISSKLRLCWESDMANITGGEAARLTPFHDANVDVFQPHAFYGGLHPLTLPPASLIDPSYYPSAAMNPVLGAVGPGAPPPMHPNPAFPPGRGQMLPPALQVPPPEVVHIWVPNNIVGALIGTKGVHIRNVMRLTGAHIRIEQQTSPGGSDGEGRSENERLVTITGNEAQQYKAQFWIYQRVCEQSYHFFDEVRLCAELKVPYKLVGRIIGKSGANVRELQRMTGAQVKIPEESSSDLEETTVKVIGNFQASQAVQSRIRQLIHGFFQHKPRLAGGHV